MCLSVSMPMCVSHYSCKTTGFFQLKFGVRKHLAHVGVLTMCHDLNITFKVTAMSTGKFTFIAISQSILELKQKCKKKASGIRPLAIQIKCFQNYVTSGLRTCPTLKIFRTDLTQNLFSYNSLYMLYKIKFQGY